MVYGTGDWISPQKEMKSEWAEGENEAIEVTEEAEKLPIKHLRRCPDLFLTKQ